MPKMGRYCKAYPVDRFRTFSGWTEQSPIEGQQPDERTFLYLQDNYVVTKDIYLDEHIVYNNVTPEWMDFCKQELKFEIPAYDQSES